jgi:2-oxoglutarate dehydrogenase E1 component
MYEQFVRDPDSVSDSWQEFFADYRSQAPSVAAAAAASPQIRSIAEEHGAPTPPAAPAPVAPAPVAPAASAPSAEKTPKDAPIDEPGKAIRGAGAAIAANMERSLGVPTATSFRNVPAKLLVVNRMVINGFRARSGQTKVSFTHLIGYAIVRAIADQVPTMKNTYVEGSDGKPRLVEHDHVNMGLAVDVAKSDGSRTLVVPVVREADTFDFGEFLAAYEELIRKVQNNKLTVDDFQGATVSLTNPGTIGTVQSVPRLMPGQGVIVGVGSIDYPAEYEGADRRTLSSLGLSKVVTITSTYDHRIIQGAESGLFLRHVHDLLLGEHGFYEGIFASLDMPYEAVKWRPDINPIDKEEAMLAKQMAVAKLVRVHRVRGHRIADIDPLRWKEPHTPRELDPATYGRTIWDLDREFLTDGVGGIDKMRLGDLLGVLRDAYCRTIGVEYMHIQNTDEQRWIQAQVEDQHVEPTKEAKDRILERLNAAEAFEKFLATKYVGTKRFGMRAPSRRSRSSTRSSRTPPTPGSTRRCSAWPIGAGSTSCPTSWGRTTRRSSRSSRGTSTRSRCRDPATSSTTSG